MENKELSIIVPVRNRERLLERCLQSIEAQSYRPLHVIVVDNGSSDSSKRVAEQWALSVHADNFRVSVVSESREGAAAARNRGLKEVESEIVAFFDSDDTMRRDLAEAAMEAFGSHRDAHLVYWKAVCHPFSGASYEMPFARKRLLLNQIQHSVLRTQCYAVKTSALRKIGAWNSDLPVWNDWELGIRMIAAGFKTVAINEVHTDIYAQPISITGQYYSERPGEREKAIYEAERTMAKGTVPNSVKALRIINARRVTLAARYYREEAFMLAEPLLREALQNPMVNAFRRSLLKFCYYYCSRGGRGAVRFLLPLL